jgi:hypothetical protein
MVCLVFIILSSHHDFGGKWPKGQFAIADNITYTKPKAYSLLAKGAENDVKS